MVDKIKTETVNNAGIESLQNDGYKFEELEYEAFYIHFKMIESADKHIIECSTIYMNDNTTTLDECIKNKIYTIPINSNKKWDNFIKYLDSHKSNIKFFYGYLLPDQTEVFLTFPYKTAIGARIVMTHIVAGFINDENLEYSM